MIDFEQVFVRWVITFVKANQIVKAVTSLNIFKNFQSI